MSRPPISILVGCLLACISHASEPVWPQFRGPGGSGIAGGKPLIHFGPESNVVWKTAVASGASSTSIAGNRIFLTGVEDEKLQTICLNHLDGKLLWRKAAPAEKLESFHMPDGSPAASTPLTDGKHIFVYF